MPSPTYVALAKTVLTGSQASITFSSIPSTYTDLILVVSSRQQDSGSYFEQFYLEFNGSATAVYSQTMVRGNSSVAGSNQNSTQAYFNYLYQTGPSNTANTFGSVEIYIPNYTGSTNKVMSSTSVVENNSTTAGESWIAGAAQLWRNTSAINQIKLTASGGGAGNFTSGSRFDLYGIKNS